MHQLSTCHDTTAMLSFPSFAQISALSKLVIIKYMCSKPETEVTMLSLTCTARHRFLSSRLLSTISSTSANQYLELNDDVVMSVHPRSLDDDFMPVERGPKVSMRQVMTFLLRMRNLRSPPRRFRGLADIWYVPDSLGQGSQCTSVCLLALFWHRDCALPPIFE